MRIAVNIQDEALRELISQVEDPSTVLLSAGNSVKKLLQAHYREKNENEPNKLGADRSNFWGDVGLSVEGPISNGSQVLVNITHPHIRQKIYGGTIKAKRTKYLTIPMHKDSYGVRARVLEREKSISLVFVETNGNKFLAGEHEGRFQFFYLLKESVTQKPWPQSIPENDDLAKSVREGAAEALLSALSAG